MDDTKDIRRLPGNLSAIARVTDYDTAITLAKAWGGLMKSIPTPEKVKASSALAKVVGIDAARKIAAEFGPLRTYIPVHRDFGSRMLKESILDEHGSEAATALKLGCSGRYVRKVRAEHRC